MANDRRITLEGLIELGVDKALIDLHTATPGIIQAFDPVTQLAEIQIAIKRKQDGELVDISLLSGVPVRFFKVANFSINAPLVPGDEVLLIFGERSIDTWLQNGGVQSPEDIRKHSTSDAFAIPYAYNQLQNITAFDPANLEIRTTDGANSIKINPAGIIDLLATTAVNLTATNINLNGITAFGGGLDSAVAFNRLKVVVDSLVVQINALITAYNAHTHLSAIPGSPSSSPSVPGVPVAGDITPAESPTLKVP